MSASPEIRAVDPARLASGRWCHSAEKTIGQGDIAGSYSADCIGMGKPVRRPFSFEGGLWVCVSIASRRDDVTAEAYRLIHPQIFDGQIMSYAERVANGDAARADPNGFYHGMRVRHGGSEFILSGAPVRFVPGEEEQLSLF